MSISSSNSDVSSSSCHNNVAPLHAMTHGCLYPPSSSAAGDDGQQLRQLDAQQQQPQMMQLDEDRLQTPPEWTCHMTMAIGDDGGLLDNGNATGCLCCSSCGLIAEKSGDLLSVNEQVFHADCLHCQGCHTPLTDNTKCFVKHDAYYCHACYVTEFGVRCARCDRVIASSDWVRRARQLTYHLACFACDVCKRQLSTGEQFALQQRTKLLCKQHYMELIEGDSGISKCKSKRVRTTFTDEQIAILQTNFQVDSNPDGQDLERIAQVTGLSKRVTQVWFQNSRARQKKYSVKPMGEDGIMCAFDITDSKDYSNTYSDDEEMEGSVSHSNEEGVDPYTDMVMFQAQ